MKSLRALFILLTLPVITPAQALPLPHFTSIMSEYGDQSSPKWTGAVALGIPISTTLWSFSMHQFIIVHGTVTDITSSGIATDSAHRETKFGRADLILLGNLGVATGTTTTLALSGGACGTLSFKNGFGVLTCGLENKAASLVQLNILAGGFWTLVMGFINKASALDFTTWLRGIIGGFISGGAAAVAGAIILPALDANVFNVYTSQFYIATGALFVANGFVSVFKFLAVQPLPEMKQIEKTVTSITPATSNTPKVIETLKEIRTEPIVK